MLPQACPYVGIVEDQTVWYNKRPAVISRFETAADGDLVAVMSEGSESACNVDLRFRDGARVTVRGKPATVAQSRPETSSVVLDGKTVEVANKDIVHETRAQTRLAQKKAVAEEPARYLFSDESVGDKVVCDGGTCVYKEFRFRASHLADGTHTVVDVSGGVVKFETGQMRNRRESVAERTRRMYHVIDEDDVARFITERLCRNAWYVAENIVQISKPRPIFVPSVSDVHAIFRESTKLARLRQLRDIPVLKVAVRVDDGPVPDLQKVTKFPCVLASGKADDQRLLCVRSAAHMKSVLASRRYEYMLTQVRLVYQGESSGAYTDVQLPSRPSSSSVAVTICDDLWNLSGALYMMDITKIPAKKGYKQQQKTLDVLTVVDVYSRYLDAERVDVSTELDDPSKRGKSILKAFKKIYTRTIAPMQRRRLRVFDVVGSFYPLCAARGANVKDRCTCSGAVAQYRDITQYPLQVQAMDASQRTTDNTCTRLQRVIGRRGDTALPEGDSAGERFLRLEQAYREGRVVHDLDQACVVHDDLSPISTVLADSGMSDWSRTLRHLRSDEAAFGSVDIEELVRLVEASAKRVYDEDPSEADWRRFLSLDADARSRLVSDLGLSEDERAAVVNLVLPPVRTITRASAVLRKGNSTPQKQYIADRVAALDGKTRDEALAMSDYGRSDLTWDLNHGYLVLVDNPIDVAVYNQLVAQGVIYGEPISDWTDEQQQRLTWDNVGNLNRARSIDDLARGVPRQNLAKAIRTSDPSRASREWVIEQIAEKGEERLRAELTSKPVRKPVKIKGVSLVFTNTQRAPQNRLSVIDTVHKQMKDAMRLFFLRPHLAEYVATKWTNADLQTICLAWNSTAHGECVETPRELFLGPGACKAVKGLCSGVKPRSRNPLFVTPLMERFKVGDLVILESFGRSTMGKQTLEFRDPNVYEIVYRNLRTFEVSPVYSKSYAPTSEALVEPELPVLLYHQKAGRWVHKHGPFAPNYFRKTASANQTPRRMVRL